MTEDFRLQLRSDPKLLCAARALVRRYLVEHGIGEEKADEAVLAVDEACANCIRHGYDGKNDCSYEIILRAGRQWLEVEVHDEGRPAPRKRVAAKEHQTPSEEELKPGGLGMHLMRAVFDEVKVITGKDKGNRVILRMKFK